MLFAAMILVGVMAQKSEKSDSQNPSLYLAKQLRELGRCQGELLNLQADMLSGALVSVAAVRAQIETANPTLTVDPTTLKITPKQGESPTPVGR